MTAASALGPYDFQYISDFPRHVQIVFFTVLSIYISKGHQEEPARQGKKAQEWEGGQPAHVTWFREVSKGGKRQVNVLKYSTRTAVKTPCVIRMHKNPDLPSKL